MIIGNDEIASYVNVNDSGIVKKQISSELASDWKRFNSIVTITELDALKHKRSVFIII